MDNLTLTSIESIKDASLAQAVSHHFAGQDPFDGLNSPIFSLFPNLKRGLPGLAWIQFHKRSIINFRPLARIEQKRNPKGVALFILGLIEDFKRSSDDSYLNTAIELADWLLTQQSDVSTWKHSCWGYHFDWNARAFFVPKGKPNIITTIYVAQALYQLSQLTENSDYQAAAIDSAHFIVNTLSTQHEERHFFAYIPGETAFVHNASLWGAAWVGFVANLTNNSEYKQLALTVARQSVKEQNSDGSWVYGARHHHQFIDGFHTGYNLEALDMLRHALSTSEFDDAIQKGLVYYRSELFESDGSAKYYHNNRYPLDMHCVSQAVLTLLKVSKTEADIQLATQVITKSIDSLYLPNKQRFVYQKHKYLTNKVNYIRWTQAWVYYSFSMYQNFISQQAK